VVAVEDTGVGIAEEEIGRLWQEFQRIDSGTGLGLALTKKLVEAHGGQVGVKSAPGKGSIFWAEWPRVAP
jgi:signal transduction histidine kinase